jgi:hypothetical protein
MLHLWLHLDDMRMVQFKAGLAAAGALLLFWYWLAEQDPRGRRVRDTLLIVIGIASCASWWNLGRFHFTPSYVIHYHEFYHYYLGGKYAPELGYTRLYECTLVAEDEYAHPGPPLAQLTIRDLRTNVLVPAAPVLAHPEDCTQHFSPQRWQAFKRDSHFFWSSVSWAKMSDVLQDHGYNATPVWRLLGGFLANRVGELNQRSAFRLALIDPVLLFAMMLAIAWAFGWRTLCVALLFFGTNFPARYFWTGGAYLRMDWLFAAIAGICLMKRERPFSAGLAIAYASLLRVFPAFLAAALVLRIVVISVRARRLVWTTAQRRFLAGAAVAIAVLLPVSTLYGGGTECWRDFIANSRKHLATPLTNNMGWHTVVAWRPSTQEQLLHDPHALDPYARWAQAQRDNFHAMRLVFLAGLVGYVVLLGAAVEHHEDWVALVLGIGLILFAAQLTCYYFIIFLGFGLLWPWLPRSGSTLALLSFASCEFGLAFSGWDDCYFAISVTYVAFVIALTAAVAWTGRQRAKPQPGRAIPLSRSLT